MRVTHGPRQHGPRPAIDPLFISAARSYGDSVAGVVLSGALGDGTAGLAAIKREGGTAIVQKPDEAALSSMPLTALQNVTVDVILPASRIGPRLLAMVAERTPGPRLRPSGNSGRTRTGRKNDMPPPSRSTPEPAGKRTLTPLTCPDCGGALWAIEDPAVDSYECHVGHRFGADALGDERTENTLWFAVRALREDAALRRRMAGSATRHGMAKMAQEWLRQAHDADRRARHVHRLIEKLAVSGQRRDKPTGATGRQGRRVQRPGSRRRRQG